MEEEESNEKISLYLSKVLDKMGYSRQIVQARRDSYQENDKLCNMSNKGFTNITSGSKGEGLSKFCESDFDFIYLHDNIVAVEEDLIHMVPSNISIFTFRADYEHPGYNLLTLHSVGPRVNESLTSSRRPTYPWQKILSSTMLAEHIKEWLIKNDGEAQVCGRSGPAIRCSVLGQEIDKVYSIPSICPTGLMEWLSRPRQYDWPPLDLRQRIARMRGNFVAKGCKESPMEHHEWRQCFNQAELLLVHSLDEMLYKLYILLKIILKDMLTLLDSESVLSSYVMKNIVFWLAETNPTDAFQEKYLIKWLLKALRMLKHSLESRFLPYYMIPARNLLAPFIKRKNRKRLLGCVNWLIMQGPRALYRCEKMVYTTTTTHTELFQFSAKRDDLEMMQLSCMNSSYRLSEQGLSFVQMLCDENLLSIGKRLEELAYDSNWPPHVQEKLDKCENIWDRLLVILK